MNEEAYATEGRFLLISVRERGVRHTTQGHVGNFAPGLVRRQKERGKTWPKACIVLPKGKEGRAGNSRGLASVDNVGGLWAIGAAPSYLVPAPR